jgi:hypothetical protein
MADDNLMLEILRNIQASTTALTQRMEVVTSTLDVHSNVLNVLRQDVLLIRAALNDFEKTRFSSGEAQVIHDELSRLHQEQDELAVRVGVLEAEKQ